MVTSKITKGFTKKTWDFKNICLYETSKVAVSTRAMSSDVRWRRIFHELNLLLSYHIKLSVEASFSYFRSLLSVGEEHSRLS